MRLWDLCDDAASCLPHQARKRLHRLFARAAALFEPPPCRDPHCCFQHEVRVDMDLNR